MRTALFVALFASACGGLDLTSKNHCTTTADCVTGTCINQLCETNIVTDGGDNDSSANGTDMKTTVGDQSTDASVGDGATALPGSWVTKMPMPTARANCGAIFGSDGRLYVIGGRSNGASIATVEAYTPTTDSWTTVDNLSVDRDGLVVALNSNGGIYAFGGDNGAATTGEVYSISTNTWGGSPSLPSPRYLAAAATGLNGSIYIFGGATTGLNDPTMISFAPSTNTWSTASFNMTTARSEHSGARLADGRIFAIGGFGNDLSALSAVEYFTPGTNGWNTAPPLQTARGYASAVTGADNRIYVFGGSGQQVNLSSVEVYTPGSNSWSYAHPMPSARVDFGAALGPDGRIYIVGGIGATVLNTLDVFTP